MKPVTLELSSDRRTLELGLDGSVIELSADMVDMLIRRLSDQRARMTPVHPAEPPSGPDQVHQGDNLLWSVQADPQRAAVRFAVQHPGLGWTALWLSRAQVEDLQTSFDFELVKIPDSR